MTSLRQMLRGAAGAPAPASVIVASLAIGIGVNAAVFSWIQRVALEPIPGVARSGELQLVEPRTGGGSGPGASWPDFRDLRAGLPGFESLVAFRMMPVILGEGPRATRVYGLLASENYFSGLGLTPAAGRFFTEEAAAGALPEVVVSHAIWQQLFAASSDLAGRTLRVNGSDLPVTGVAPAGFQGTVLALDFAVWLSPAAYRVIMPTSRELDDRSARGLTLLGRLRADTTAAAAQLQLEAVMARLATAFPASNRGLGAGLLPFWRAPRGPQRMFLGALALLQSVLLVVLLAVCGNASTLLLSRAAEREHEFAVRLALGATPGRIVRQLIGESLLLAGAGAVLGALLAVWGTDALRVTPMLGGLPLRFDTHVNATTLAFTLAVALVAAVAFGAAPALHLASIAPALNGRLAASRSGQRSALRDGVLAAQLALAVIVLIAATIFLQRFGETLDADPGFRRDGVLLAAYDLSGRPRDGGAARLFAARLLERLQQLPVEGAAIAASVPLDIHGLPLRAFTLAGRATGDIRPDQALSNIVSPGYFRTLGIRLLQGRDFSGLTSTAGTAEAIVNRAFAARYLPNREPLGATLSSGGRDYLIIGVVETTTSDAFGEPPTPAMYFSWRDRPGAAGQVHIRARPGGEGALAASVREAVAALDPDVPVYDVRTLTEHVDRNLVLRRIPARLFVVLGPLLLLLALSGVHAAAARAVTQHARELGLRMALGATPARLIAESVRDRLLVVAVGLAAGWTVAFGLAGQLASGPGGWLAYGAVPSLLFAVAAVACWLPARRIAAIDPVETMRGE